MSFKDKPLKKIVADTRVTIDAIHTNIIDDLSVEKNTLEHKKEELEKLKGLTELSGQDYERIKILEKEIKGFDEKKEINYYLDTGLLLNDYYSKKNGEIKQNSKATSVLDLFSFDS